MGVVPAFEVSSQSQTAFVEGASLFSEKIPATTTRGGLQVQTQESRGAALKSAEM